MKQIKTIFASLILAFSMVMTLSACSDNDDKEPSVPAAKSVAGIYEGTMTCSVAGSDSEFENMTFTLTAIDDAHVTLTVSSFGNPPMQVPELQMPDIAVSGENGTYALANTKFEQETNGKKCSGVVEGSYAQDRLTIQFTLNYGAMPMPMICTFIAPKK